MPVTSAPRRPRQDFEFQPSLIGSKTQSLKIYIYISYRKRIKQEHSCVDFLGKEPSLGPQMGARVAAVREQCDGASQWL